MLPSITDIIITQPKPIYDSGKKEEEQRASAFFPAQNGRKSNTLHSFIIIISSGKSHKVTHHITLQYTTENLKLYIQTALYR